MVQIFVHLGPVTLDNSHDHCKPAKVTSVYGLDQYSKYLPHAEVANQLVAVVDCGKFIVFYDAFLLLTFLLLSLLESSCASEMVSKWHLSANIATEGRLATICGSCRSSGSNWPCWSGRLVCRNLSWLLLRPRRLLRNFTGLPWNSSRLRLWNSNRPRWLGSYTDCCSLWLSHTRRITYNSQASIDCCVRGSMMPRVVS